MRTLAPLGISLVVILFVFGVTLTGRAGADPTSGEEIGIQVSPSTVALHSEGVWVTVHADIPYSAVATATLTLNGIEVEWTKADSRGDLVGKFCLDEVKDIVEAPTTVLTLEGETREGIPFSGSDTIRVTE